MYRMFQSKKISAHDVSCVNTVHTKSEAPATWRQVRSEIIYLPDVQRLYSTTRTFLNTNIS